MKPVETAENSKISDDDYDELPDISVSFEREIVRSTLGKVDEDEVREYLNFCLQQEYMYLKWLEMFNQT